MRRVLATMLVLACLPVGCRAATRGEADAPRPLMSTSTFVRSVDAVVQIETPHRIGGGFVVGEAGWVATSYAVIEGERQARVVLGDGRMLPVTRVLASDPKRDLAVVAVEAEGLPVAELVGTARIAAGDELAIVGHALGMFAPSARTTTVAVTPRPGGAGWLRLSSPMLAGYAGAPVMDANGRVVAVIGSELADEASVAAPAEQLARLLRGLEANAGEPLAEFGARTRGIAADRDVQIGPEHIMDCSTRSRERVWSEIHLALVMAAPIYQAGGDEAAFRVLESATLRLATELEDCQALLRALEQARVQGRESETPTAGTQLLGQLYEDVADLLFAAPTSHELTMR